MKCTNFYLNCSQMVHANTMKILQIWIKECWLPWLLPWRSRSILDMVRIRDMQGIMDADHIQNRQAWQLAFFYPDLQFSHENRLKFSRLKVKCSVSFVSWTWRELQQNVSLQNYLLRGPKQGKKSIW